MNEASMLTPQYAQYTGEPVKVEPVLSVSGLCIEYPNERTYAISVFPLRGEKHSV